jgi:hypothetical protein
MPDDERYDAADLAAAEALDAAVGRVLAGVPASTDDPTLLWLAAAMRVDPPPALGQRIRREHARREIRRWRPVQLVAAAVAALMLSQGVGDIVNGAWVARGLGEDYSPHAFIEGGLALLAVGIAIAAGVLHRRWLPVSVATGAPLAVVFGVRGIGEIGEFTAGAALHLSQGALGLLLAAAWWRAWRYGRAPASEGEA